MCCFGGPVAHLGYFRAEFVARRRWLDERAFADLIGLCQFLPGPASSQTGFAIGLLRAGYPGGFAAWAGFTLPSAVLMTAFAYVARGMARSTMGNGLLHGLKLVAVAIVAQAVWGMARTLCPDRQRATVATASAVFVVLVAAPAAQAAAIAAGALAGVVVCRATDAATPESPRPMPVSRTVAVASLTIFVVLLALGPLIRGSGMGASVFDAFYRSGALVFGGGHVVLPLLRDAVVDRGWISPEAFLAGYGAAQAVPGPLFAFAGYLGASLRGPLHGPAGAAIALVAIFLPGILLVAGTLPFWHQLRARPAAGAAMRGVNAAVVGLLGAALYDPVWTGAVLNPADFACALLCFVLLVAWRAPPLLVVAVGASFGLVAAASH
jgi:chromate transporter